MAEMDRPIVNTDPGLAVPGPIEEGGFPPP
jgi:hypothetical protein